MNIAEWQVEHVRRFGPQIGLVSADREYSNRELHDRSRSLARGLLESGLEPGDRVALCVRNAAELFIAADAVYFAGMVLVILPNAPAPELNRIIEHCEPAAIVVDPDVFPADGDSGRSISILTRRVTNAGWLHAKCLEDVYAGCGPLERPIERRASDPVQLCLTSGTTGAPRAAVYTHGSIGAYLQDRAAALGDRSAAIHALVAFPPAAFAGRFVAMRAVTNQRLVLLEQFEPRRALAMMESQRIAMLPLLPTMAEQLVACRWDRQFDLSALQAVSIAGARVSRALLLRLKALFSKHAGAAPAISVHYGMTEAGGGIASTERGGEEKERNLGRLVPGVSVKICDQEGDEVAAGVAGEIVVRTPYAASGYWRDPERTAAVFRDDGIHTGDLGTLSETGELYLVGRCKDVVNQGGVKIMPAEIAEVIENVGGVRECAVLGVEAELLGEEAVACVVCEPGVVLDAHELLRHCRDVLGPRKAPGQVCFFEHLPRRPTGKIDRTALISHVARVREERLGPPPQVSPEGRRDFVHQALVSALEAVFGRELIATLRDWSTVVLGDLGLDSLGAVWLAHALSERLGVRLGATMVYANPTVAELRDYLQRRVWEETHQARAPERHERAADASDPIAIVGIGCRVPGAGSVAELWSLLVAGESAVGFAPAARMPASTKRWIGSFLQDAGAFDARFFGLEMRAAEMDPRHRLLLEVTWEAFEDAGVEPLRLPGERTGVFLGLCGEMHRNADPLAGAPGMAAAYLGQFFDIRGPVVSVDTTCSSSLVAVHSAVGSLYRSECDIAVAGGVSLLSSPPSERTVGIISSDGRSRAFAANADGFGQGEGCVLLILKRLSSAERDGDRVYAVILASGINHTGRSAGLVAPNPRSQAALVEDVLRRARLRKEDVQYVEAHGTGTALGDPIEVEALASVFADRQGEPLRIGSVKTNVGHLEAASGAIGLAKAALCTYHDRLVPSLHLDEPNPRIPWASIPIRVQTELSRWPSPEAPKVSGVSAFGMSGTNAHVLIRDAPALKTAAVEDEASAPGPWVMCVSAKSTQSLQELTRRWRDALETSLSDVPCQEIAHFACTRRSHFDERIAVIGNSTAEWAAALKRAGVNTGRTLTEKRRPEGVVMLFSGQGSQWPGMGSELFESEPVFRETLLRCDHLIRERASWSLLSELQKAAGRSQLGETQFAQPALFSIQASLYELWLSLGVTPTVVTGHSLGEITAAYAAGCLTLEQAVELACKRGRAMQHASQPGAMMHARMSIDDASAFVENHGEGVSIAAVNGPRSVTLAGDAAALAKAKAVLAARGVMTRMLQSGRAFHSEVMRPAARELFAHLQGLTPSAPKCRIISTLTATDAPLMDAGYWASQAVSPVRFMEACIALLDARHSVFVEIGSHPVLLPGLYETAESRGELASVRAAPSMSRGSERRAFCEALATVYRAGVGVDWSKRFRGSARVLDAPRYAWDRVSCSRVPDEANGAAMSEVELTAWLRQHIALSQPVSAHTATLRELGVDSVDLIQLRARLEASFGSDIPPGREMLGLTIEGLASAVLRRGERTSSNQESFRLTTLREKGRGPDCIWIHPVGGGVGCYEPLVERLPFGSKGIEMLTVSDSTEEWASVGALAERYCDRLRESVPSERELVLGGWSFGGIVAYEMAIRLEQHGYRVPLVVMLDSYLGESADRAAAPFDLEDAWQRGIRESEWLGPGAEILDDSKRQALRCARRVFDANYAAAKRYSPKQYGGRVLYVRASQHGGAPEAVLKRVALLAQCEVVDADHYSIVEAPVVDAVADAIVRHMREIRETAAIA